MIRISGIDLPKNKRLVFALTLIYGIGLKTSKDILKAINISENKKVSELDDGDIVKIKEEIEQSHKVEGDLRREVSLNIKRLMDLNCYRGSRHKKRLPSRGQRTHSNARTRKSNKKKDMLY